MDLLKHILVLESSFSLYSEVVVSGNVSHKGMIGTVVEFNNDKTFAVVQLHSDGKKYSFHTSDLEKAPEQDEDEDDQDDSLFYVALYDEDARTGWVGMLSNADGKWRETLVAGEASHNWGSSYMSYLSPRDVMGWIEKDYRDLDVEGPFTSAREAKEYLKRNYDYTV